MAAINCNTITGTPAPHPPQPSCYTPHDLTTTSLMIRKTDQCKCSQADENPCWPCTHAHFSPRDHPLVKAWPGGGWRGAALSLSQVSLLLYSLGRVQHCSLQSAAPCSHMPAPPAQGVMNSRTRTLLHFPAHYFPLFAYFPIHAINFSPTRTSRLDADRFAVLYWLCIWIFPASIDHSPNMDHKLTTITAQ